MQKIKAKNFFSKEQEAKILHAIREAEHQTSGEIRVHIENKCPIDVLDRAAYWFEKLDMNQTAQRNGVLIYLALKNRQFAIIGDAGINAVVPDNFWEQIKDNMAAHFREGRFSEGIIEAILSAGQQLKKHFPHKPEDINELPDEVSYGDS